MIVLFTQDASLCVSVKVGFKNISLKGIHFGLMYRSVRLSVDCTVFWSDKPPETVSIWILSHVERVITRSSQRPRMCVAKDTCCFKSNEVRISSKVMVTDVRLFK